MGYKSADGGKGVAWVWVREHPDEEPPKGLAPKGLAPKGDGNDEKPR